MPFGGTEANLSLFRKALPGGDSKDGVEEEELAVEAPPDVDGLAEPVALPGEDDEGRDDPLVLERLVHRLRLVERHHLVILALEEDDRAVELLDRVDWRALLERPTCSMRTARCMAPIRNLHN